MSDVIVFPSERPRTPVAAIKPHLAAWKWFRKFSDLCSDSFYTHFFFAADHPSAAENAVRLRENAWRVHRRMPPPEVIEEARTTIVSGLSQFAEPEHILDAVQALAAGRANLDPIRRAGFVAATAEVLMLEAEVAPFSTAALAAGVFKNLTESKFIPEPVELLESIRSAGTAMAGLVGRLDRLTDASVMAWQVLRELGEITVPENGLDDTIPADDRESGEAAPAALPSSSGIVMPLVLPEREAVR